MTNSDHRRGGKERIRFPGSAPLVSQADRGSVVYAEHALVAAVLGDASGETWKRCAPLPEHAFTDAHCRALWHALQDGAPSQDQFELARRAGVSCPVVFSIGKTDPEGKFLSGSFDTVSRSHYRQRLVNLGQRIIEAPDTDVRLLRAELDNLLRSTLPLLERTLRQRIQERRFNFAAPPSGPTPRFYINGKAVSTPGNLTNIIAQIKVGKSSFIAAKIAAAMVAEFGGRSDTLGVTAAAPSGRILIHVDTEQSPADHDGLVRSALRRAGIEREPEWFRSYCLTGFSAAEIREALWQLMADAQAAGGVFAVIIDGAADAVADVNDADECNAFVAQLQNAAIKFDCPIVSVVHENPGQDNGKMRGHLGSQLLRKGESNIRLKKTEEITVVFSERMRRAPILEKDGPRFKWDEEEKMHVSCETLGETLQGEEDAYLKSLAAMVFGGKLLTYAEACVKLRELKGFGPKAAEKWFTRLRKGGFAKEVSSGVYSACVG